MANIFSLINDKFDRAVANFHAKLDQPLSKPDPQLVAYRKAANSVSQSGEFCKLLALLGVASSPFIAIYAFPFGLGLAASVFSGSCALGAIGSSATSNKRTANILSLGHWERLYSYDD